MTEDQSAQFTLTSFDKGRSLRLPSLRVSVTLPDRRVVEASLGIYPLLVGTSAECDLVLMRAAVRMSRAVSALGDGELLLKIGLHSGACIAVELNERLDYFGRTVNIAARVQGLAASGEIVCTEIVYSAPGVREVVAAAGLVSSRVSASLRGICGDVPVMRLAAAGAQREDVA